MTQITCIRCNYTGEPASFDVNPGGHCCPQCGYQGDKDDDGAAWEKNFEENEGPYYYAQLDDYDDYEWEVRTSCGEHVGLVETEAMAKALVAWLNRTPVLVVYNGLVSHIVADPALRLDAIVVDHTRPSYAEATAYVTPLGQECRALVEPITTKPYDDHDVAVLAAKAFLAKEK